jgi:hypothetical protein
VSPRPEANVTLQSCAALRARELMAAGIAARQRVTLPLQLKPFWAAQSP